MTIPNFRFVSLFLKTKKEPKKFLNIIKRILHIEDEKKLYNIGVLPRNYQENGWHFVENRIVA